MSRHLCNLGIKALTGKNLNDFGYNYWEDAFVSGNVEYIYNRRPIHVAEVKSSRFRAIAAYCRWLREEKPAIYRLLDPHE